MVEFDKVLIKDIDRRDKGVFSFWLQDINVVKFFIELFKVSRKKDNVLNIPFGKNRKVLMLETKEGLKIGFCMLYDIDWQQKRCSIYIYIEDREMVSIDTAKEIIKSLMKGAFIKYNFKDIEVHTKDYIMVKCFGNIDDLKKIEDEFIFKIAVDRVKFPADMAQ